MDIRPWRLYRSNAAGNSFEVLLSRVAFVPELVWCILFRSSLQYRDRCFIAAFIFQNRAFFNANDIRRVLFEFNPNFADDRWAQIEGIVQWFTDAEQNADDDANLRLCQYYAFDIMAQRVLDLRGHIRHWNVPVPYYDRDADRNDPCLPYLRDYHEYDRVSLEQICAGIPVVKETDEGLSVVSVRPSVVREVFAELEEDGDTSLPSFFDDEEAIECIEWIHDNYELFAAETLDVSAPASVDLDD